MLTASVPFWCLEETEYHMGFFATSLDIFEELRYNKNKRAKEGHKMIYGTGIDIVEIDRIKKTMENPNFLQRFFSGEERDYFSSRGFAPQTVAGNFAGKEAFSKAIGTGISGFRLEEVEILRDELGKPHIALSGAAKKIADEMGISGLYISISHSKHYAVAQVIAEH